MHLVSLISSERTHECQSHGARQINGLDQRFFGFFIRFAIFYMDPESQKRLEACTTVSRKFPYSLTLTLSSQKLLIVCNSFNLAYNLNSS